MNKKLGYTMGSNLFRKMAVTQELDKLNPTAEDRVALAKIMRHSPVVQITYLRKKQLIA